MKKDILEQVNYFASEILRLLDRGESITIKEFERQMDDDKNIVDFIADNYGFENQNSIPCNQDILKQILDNFYVTEKEGENICISNNGLVYLLHILFRIAMSEAYTYKANQES